MSHACSDLAMLRVIESFVLRKRAASLAQANLGWLWTNKANFQISKEVDKEIPWRVKPVGELVFLLTTLNRHGLRCQTSARLAAYALEQASGFDWHELAAYDPSAATVLALIGEFFALEGQSPPFERPFFDFLERIRFFEGMDRLAYREMDFAYSLGRIGNSRYESSLATWFSSTAFGRRQQITRYNIDDLYSLTHAVFYLTDMGLRELEQFLDGDTTVRARSKLVALTAMMLRADNVDVLAELMLCWLFCRIEMSNLHRRIFDQGLVRLFVSATQEGAVAPTSKIHARAKTSQASFDELYHTTLVCALLFSLLRRG